MKYHHFRRRFAHRNEIENGSIGTDPGSRRPEGGGRETSSPSRRRRSREGQAEVD